MEITIEYSPSNIISRVRFVYSKPYSVPSPTLAVYVRDKLHSGAYSKNFHELLEDVKNCLISVNDPEVSSIVGVRRITQKLAYEVYNSSTEGSLKISSLNPNKRLSPRILKEIDTTGWVSADRIYTDYQGQHTKRYSYPGDFSFIDQFERFLSSNSESKEKIGKLRERPAERDSLFTSYLYGCLLYVLNLEGGDDGSIC